jgi:putative phosphoribosyl transferase
MFAPLFTDREDAGRRLAQRMEGHRFKAPVVLAVPRGGVVVGDQVSRRLGAPLDLIIARKIGAPGQPELAIGAVVSDADVCLIDERAVAYLGVSSEYLETEVARQQEEIARRLQLYRDDRPPPEVANRTVIVVDDGIATGYTMRAALTGLRRRAPRQLVVAVPVAPPSVGEELRDYADEVVCLATPDPFVAVGVWYENFEQTTDEEVRRLVRGPL